VVVNKLTVVTDICLLFHSYHCLLIASIVYSAFTQTLLLEFNVACSCIPKCILNSDYFVSYNHVMLTLAYNYVVFMALFNFSPSMESVALS